MVEEGSSEITANKKRPRDDSGLDSDQPESKRVDSGAEPELDLVDPLVGLGSSDVQQIREDILDILDEPDTEADASREGAEIQDLDSFIKSFQDEILNASPANQPEPAGPVVEQLTTSESGESPSSQPDLGYLLEASDDELGLPPTETQAEKNEQHTDLAVNDNADLNNMMRFVDNELPGFDSFEFGLGDNLTNGGEFVTVDGLFDYSEPSDFSEFTWRPESLPAV